jgi:hypothetical protein
MARDGVFFFSELFQVLHEIASIVVMIEQLQRLCMELSNGTAKVVMS